jgi:D-xylose 1-dehydrogenase (NADP+, D-xylono-1,5-lactone-forming)
LAKDKFASIVAAMNKVRWGFIGAGYIARIALYPALLNSNYGEIYAVGSKDRERGLALSPTGLVYTDYEELIADPNVEAIYISLPNSLHIEWSIKAMRAGKHVLCEKPIAMNVAELKEAIAVANETGLIFMEASWNRWHPRTIRLKEIVDSGEIGDIKDIRSAFTYDQLDPSNIRAIYELGGGGLYDLGPYSVAAPIWLMNYAPVTNIETEVKWHPQGCDETVTTSFDIGGAHAQALTSMNIPLTLYLDVVGTKGRASLIGNDAFNSHNKASQIEVEVDGEKRVEDFPPCDPYQLMADAMSRRIRGGEGWLMPHSDSLAFAEVFDRAFQTMGRPN